MHFRGREQSFGKHWGYEEQYEENKVVLERVEKNEIQEIRKGESKSIHECRELSEKGKDRKKFNEDKKEKNSNSLKSFRKRSSFDGEETYVKENDTGQQNNEEQ